VVNKIIYKCLFKLIPYEYIKKLNEEHSTLVRIKHEKEDRILQLKAKADIEAYLATKPSNYLEALTIKIKPDVVPLGLFPDKPEVDSKEFFS